jgi:hypothetical protein
LSKFSAKSLSNDFLFSMYFSTSSIFVTPNY